MRFGARLAVFLVVALSAILGITGYATYLSIRATLIEDGKAQLTASGGQFIRQLDEMERQVASGVTVLTLDFALRQSIATGDRPTVLSVLRNHGRRVGASRLLLIGSNGAVTADTAEILPPGQRFAFADLLDRARDQGVVTTVAVIDAVADLLVIVPLLAPEPIGFVAVMLPLDDALMNRLRSLTGLPRFAAIAVAGLDGTWRIASGPADPAFAAHIAPALQANEPQTVTTLAGETIFLAIALKTAHGSQPVAAVLGYPLADALRRYQRLVLIVVIGLAGGLVAAVVGAWIIARGLVRPLEVLAQYAARIGAGDYTPPPPAPRRDEIGQLSAALAGMARAIAQREEQIRFQATHDPVTNLPNRQAWMDAAAPHLRGDAAVVVIGLTRLQEIANTVGRDIADRIMVEAGARLRGGLGDVPLACVGERSFAVLLAGRDAAGALVTVARMIDLFDRPYQERDLTIDVPVAAGTALCPAHGTDPALLLRRAEVALQVAQQLERRSAVYRAETDPNPGERLSLMSDLRGGLQRGEFQLAFQPRLDLATWRIAGAEALVRWHHPTQGVVSPERFISLAEETGNIQHLTRWALRAGLAELSRWHARGLDLRMSINASVRDLADTELPARLAMLLHTFSVPPAALVIELTESAVMGEPEAAFAVLRRIAEQGISIAIDDFGVGHSSLAYLRRLPVRELKIDKAFVLPLPDSPEDQTIVRSVIELGHRLGYSVTAEGVQDATSLSLLRTFGCDHAQGFYIAGGLAPEEFVQFVRDWPSRGAPNPSQQ